MQFFIPALRVITGNRGWILTAVIIFLGSAVVFYAGTTAAPAPSGEVTDSRLEGLQELANIISEAGPPARILLIFSNNFITITQMLLLGVLAGISPLATLGINGALVGIMLALTAGEGLPLLPTTFAGLLPHGIFELPAFLVCGAMGLKFGYHCIASPLPGKTRFQSYKLIWKEVFAILPLITLLLFAAALVEVLITPVLFRQVLP